MWFASGLLCLFGLRLQLRGLWRRLLFPRGPLRAHGLLRPAPCRGARTLQPRDLSGTFSGVHGSELRGREQAHPFHGRDRPDRLDGLPRSRLARQRADALGHRRPEAVAAGLFADDEHAEGRDVPSSRASHRALDLWNGRPHGCAHRPCAHREDSRWSWFRGRVQHFLRYADHCGCLRNLLRTGWPARDERQETSRVKRTGCIFPVGRTAQHIKIMPDVEATPAVTTARGDWYTYVGVHCLRR
mmetsp:Transcript_53230/g.171723  ORF Transcript_53230/g.171723 Transcript_53230/m.171723 type:complete len:243 (-) Transcript_53230:184-912(-)